MKRILIILFGLMTFISGCKKMDDSTTWDDNPFDPNFKHKVLTHIHSTWTLANSGGSTFYLGNIEVDVDMSEFTNGVGHCRHDCRLSYRTVNNVINDSFLFVAASENDMNSFTYNIGQVDELQDVVFQYQLVDNGVILYSQNIPIHIPAF